MSLIDWNKQTIWTTNRFCSPASQCPTIDVAWQDPRGVAIDAIIFGGRRPSGVPLVYESFNWQHGVFIGSSVRSEVTAAAEYKGHDLMHDPFSARPFLSYNVGHYIDHWLKMEKPQRKMPKIFHVNWFRRNDQVKLFDSTMSCISYIYCDFKFDCLIEFKGDFLWPGFGENIRVLDWIIRRCAGEDIAETSPIGLVPKIGKTLRFV